MTVSTRPELAEALFASAQRTTVHTEAASCGWPGVARRAAALASELRDHCERGTAVGLALRLSDSYVTALLAIWLADLVAVLLDPHSADRAVEGAQSLAVRRILVETGDGRLPVLAETAEGVLCEAAHGEAERSLQDHEALVLGTSGSTGAGKDVVLSASGILSNAQAVARFLDLSPADSTVIFTPAHFASAYSRLLSHLVAGADVTLAADGLRDLSTLLRLLSGGEGVTGLGGNPSAFQLVLPRLRRTLDCRYVMTCGQDLRPELAARLQKAFPRASLVSMYGCTENSPRVTMGAYTQDDVSAHGVYPVGRPVEGVQLRIDRLPGHGGSGEILVGGTSLASRYWDSGLTRERFTDGWFHTRDVGRLLPDGSLMLTGRLDTQINVGGYKILAEEVERVARRVEGVSEAGAFAVPHPLFEAAVGLAVVATEPPTASEIRGRCRELLGSHASPEVIVVVPRLPRTPWGKIDRPALAKFAEDFSRRTVHA